MKEQTRNLENGPLATTTFCILDRVFSVRILSGYANSGKYVFTIIPQGGIFRRQSIHLRSDLFRNICYMSSMYSCIWNFNNDFLMDEVSAKYLREINSKLIKNVAWNVRLDNLKRNANKINKNVK